METLRGVFPSVPTAALLRVLEVCDQSVALASTWLLENDWRDLAPTVGLELSTEAQGGDLQDDEDSEDEDEAADNDEDDDDAYYSEDETLGEAVLPLLNRVKVQKGAPREPAVDDFWVAFDGQVVLKSMIELLNTTLSKLAHRKVVLLNQPAKEISEAEATAELRSIVARSDPTTTGNDAAGERVQSPQETTQRRGITLSSLLNGGSPCSVTNREEIRASSRSSEAHPTAVPEGVVGEKRKRKAETEACPHQGFFAHFFPVRELDMVWRTVMHAHLFKKRFGEKIEFHTASGGPSSFSKPDFDELMHIQGSAASSRTASLNFSPLAKLKCCLILPCSADEEEILRVGCNIHGVLKVQGNLYYRVLDSLNEPAPNDHYEVMDDNDKMTEERFRQFARYRVREKVTTREGPKDSKAGLDSYLSYEQPRKPSYSLELLEDSKWSHRLSG